MPGADKLKDAAMYPVSSLENFKMAKKLPTVRSLTFDSSGSAIARFFGKPAVVGVHWAKAKVAQVKLVCPLSIGQAATKCKHSIETGPNTFSHPAPSERLIALCWDVQAKQWAVFIGHALVFGEVASKMKAAGVTPQVMAVGLGPDVILQRLGNKTMAEIVPESIGVKPPGCGDAPDFDEYLRSLEEKSAWATFATPEELAEAYPLEGGSGNAPVKWGVAPQKGDVTFEKPYPPEEVAEAKEGRKAKKRVEKGPRPPSGGELDGIVGNTRWDFIS